MAGCGYLTHQPKPYPTSRLILSPVVGAMWPVLLAWQVGHSQADLDDKDIAARRGGR